MHIFISHINTCTHTHTHTERKKKRKNPTHRHTHTHLIVTPPVFHAKVSEVPQHVQPFSGGDVPVALFLDFFEHPRLDEGASGQHYT